jgi:hypothetical protein
MPGGLGEFRDLRPVCAEEFHEKFPQDFWLAAPAINSSCGWAWLGLVFSLPGLHKFQE